MGECIELGKSVLLRPCSDLTGFAPVLVDLQRMMAGLGGDLTLSQWAAGGTPPGQSVSPSNQSALRLKTPALTYRNGSLQGAGTLSVGSNYPNHLIDPLDIDVRLLGADVSISDRPLLLQTPGLGSPEAKLHGQARFLSIFTTDWRLQVHYDNNRLSRAVETALARRGGQGSLNNLGQELRYPGFDLSAVVRASLPLLGEIPVSKLSFSAPTTRPIGNPLPGAAFPIPYRYQIGGLVPTPPGTLFDTWAVGLGYSRSNFTATRGTSFNAAILPTISVEGGSSLLERFPVYGYLEYYRIHKVSEGLDLGFRFTLSPSSVDLARLRGSTKQDEDVLTQFRTGTKELEEKARARTMINFEIVGRHNWLGGK
jgi:hypothetical protein